MRLMGMCVAGFSVFMGILHKLNHGSKVDDWYFVSLTFIIYNIDSG